ncbi:MAG: BACON domain-containing protein [Alistipes shahii]
MKTIFQYLLLTAACAALGACQDFSDDTAFTPETPELSFVETSITAEKATKDYELSIKSNLPWRIECDKDWVSFDPSYGPGDATITVTVAANRTLDERTATISAYVIKGENVTLPVTQAAASASGPGDALLCQDRRLGRQGRPDMGDGDHAGQRDRPGDERRRDPCGCGFLRAFGSADGHEDRAGQHVRNPQQLLDDRRLSGRCGRGRRG